MREASRVLKSGGILAVMHEPNIRFPDSLFFRYMAKVFSVIAHRFDRPSSNALHPHDYGPVFSHVNQELISQGLIQKPLEASEIQALVDVHSPTARGKYERVGFDVREWQQKLFRDWNMLEWYTYNFLGKIDPTAFRWRSLIEVFFSAVSPRHGSLFTYIVRKP